MVIDRLPSGLTARVPTAADAPAVAALLAAHQRAAKGSAGVDAAAVFAQLAGTGSWTRRQALVHDEAGASSGGCRCTTGPLAARWSRSP